MAAAARKANTVEEAIAQDEVGGKIYSLATGELLRAKGLCPLVIVRTYGAGVHVGYLARNNESAQVCELIEPRRIWRWYGANELYALAATGGDAKRGCISQPGSQVQLPYTEIIPVHEKAAASLTTSRWVL